jgi:hypothetical protein
MNRQHTLISDLASRSGGGMGTLHVNLETNTAIEAPLRIFAKAIREQLRGVRFAQYSNNINDMLHVYYPGDVFALGSISYRDMQVTETLQQVLEYHSPPRTFNVVSRTIDNKRFSTFRIHSHTVMSGSMDRAVKNALKYLRMYTLPEMMVVTISSFAREARDYIYEIKQERGKIFDEVNMNVSDWAMAKSGETTNLTPALLREMQFMLDDKYVFRDPLVKDVISRMLEVQGQCNLETRFASGPFWFVRAKQGGSFDTIYRRDVDDPNDEQKAYLPDIVPEVMAHRLAILSINDTGTYVGGIGYRHCNDLYFVYDKEAPEEHQP